MITDPFPERGLARLIHRDQLPILRAALGDCRNLSLAITGKGGTGKTVLAQQLLAEVVDQYPGGIIGLSGYALSQSQFEAELGQLRKEVQNRTGRKLLLIDGAEAVPLHHLVGVMASAYLRDTDSQVLFTSRLQLPDVDFALELGPMSQSERQNLWNSYNFNMGPQGLESLFKLAQGHLLTELLLGQAIKDKQLEPEEFAKYFRNFDSPGIVDSAGSPLEGLSKKSALVTSFTAINDEVFKLFTKSPQLLYQLTNRQFEEFVAELFARQGYEVNLTPASKDGGKDLYIATRSDLGTLLFVVECKKYAPDRPVGVELVRHLYGVVESERVTGGILATTSRFTRDAKKFQESFWTRLNLKDYIELQKLLKKTMQAK
jgi:restriction system protein